MYTLLFPALLRLLLLLLMNNFTDIEEYYVCHIINDWSKTTCKACILDTL